MIVLLSTVFVSSNLTSFFLESFCFLGFSIGAVSSVDLVSSTTFSTVTTSSTFCISFGSSNLTSSIFFKSSTIVSTFASTSSLSSSFTFGSRTFLIDSAFGSLIVLTSTDFVSSIFTSLFFSSFLDFFGLSTIFSIDSVSTIDFSSAFSIKLITPSAFSSCLASSIIIS